MNMVSEFLDGTLHHSTDSWHITLSRPKTLQLNNIFNNYRPSMEWHDCHRGFRGLFAYSIGSQLNVINTNAPYCIWSNWGKSALPRKKADRGKTKVLIDHKIFQRVARGLCSIVRGLILTLLEIFTSCEASGGTSRVIILNMRAVHIATHLASLAVQISQISWTGQWGKLTMPPP